MATAVLVVVYLAMPDRGAARSVIPMLGIIALVVASARRAWVTPRGRRSPWVLLSLSIPCFALSDLMIVAWPSWTGTIHPWPGPAHLPFQLGLVLLAGSLTVFVRRRQRTDVAAVLDAAVVGASLSIVVWVSVVGPLTRSPLADGPLGLGVVISHPLLHVLLVVAIWRFAQLGVAQHVAAVSIVTGLATLVVTSLGMGTLALNGIYRPDGALAVGWLLVAGALTLAAVHPSATELTDPHTPVVHRTPARRIAPHGVAALALPGVLLLRGDGDDGTAIATATAIVLSLITIRVFRLLRQLETTRAVELADERQRTQRRFESLVRHTADIVVVVGPTGTIEYATPTATPLFGADPVGSSTRDLLSCLHPDERRATATALADRIERGDGRPIRMRVRLVDAAARELDADLVVIDRRADPDVGGLVFTVHDTTERTQLESELRHLAFHDPLTGLPNRTLFQQRLETALHRAERTGTSIAVLLCDLDDFKDINDTLGHPAGDELLIQLGGRLSASLRANDTLARIGGDEFAVLCEDLDETRDAVATAQRLLGATDATFRLDDRQIRIGLSIGIAVDRGERDAQDMFRDADIALYEAKSDGKQCWSLHRAAMTAATVARRQLADDLARAVEAGEIEVAYQAVHALDDGRVTGAEALARWHHPVRGPIDPERFIAMAEGTGLIGALGEIVLDKAVAAAAVLHRAYPLDPLRMGVNVSSHQLRSYDTVDQVLAALHRHDVPAEHLILELTETAMLEDTDRVLEVMHALREHGVRFAIDDFGTGYSSLAYLRRLPVDIVKIDRSFVVGMATDPAARQLVGAIIQLCRTLELDVVAEGVEDDDQRDLLIAAGTGFAQGYHYQRPADLESLLGHIERSRLAAEGSIGRRAG
jgi:diguanylate cyclase (GGDEF)-like protein/PAS domain S-box-containing protein